MKKYKLLWVGVSLVMWGAGLNAGAQTVPDTSVVELRYKKQPSEPGPLLQIPYSRSVTSYATVSGETLFKTPVANLTNTLYGRLPGLSVTQGSGEPGYDGAGLSIRGMGTYDNAGLVIYIDGFQTNNSYFAYLSPSEIESISILKDPVSLATFGMKGANGILWVTTKRGTVSKPKVQVNVVSGLNSPININKPYGSYDYARLYNQAISNDNYALNGYQFNWTPHYTDVQLEAYRNGTGTNVDWYDETLKKTSPYTNANVILSGGETNTKYSIVLDYMKQGGLYNIPTNATTSNAQIQRFNLRSNLDFSFFKIFEAKVDLGGRIEDRRYPNINGGVLWGNFAGYPSNIYPVKDPATGNWSGTALFPNNPVAAINALGWTSTHDRTLQANFSLRQKLDFITPGLYLNEAVSFNTWTRTNASKTATYARYFNGAPTTTDLSTDIVSNGNSPVNQYDWKQVNLTAGYDRTMGKHAFNAAVNYFGSDYLVDNSQHPAGGRNRGINVQYHFQNLGGRFHYTYDTRYILELAFGWSGSDNYAPGNRWGFYPAIAAGWVLSNENFLRGNSVVDFLKLRASVGQSGFDQSNSGRYLYQQYFTGSGTYYTGNASLNNNSGLVPFYSANPSITAEKSTKFNVGLDATLWKGLSLNLDAFQDNRTGIVTVNRFLSALYGGSLPYENIGEVRNRGFEGSASYTGGKGSLQYTVGAMAAYAKNKIINQAELPPANPFSQTTGLPIGTPIGLIADGLYDITDFNANGTLKAGFPVPAFGAVQPGDIRYLDLDGNNRVDQNDVTNIGNPDYSTLTYAFNAGLQYKGFDLTALFQGTSGKSVNLLWVAYSQTVAFVNNSNVFPIAGNAWAYYPGQGIDTRATADYPRLTTKANDNNYRNSTFWMKDVSFIRLRNVELGYSFSSELLQRVKLDGLRIYVSAVNPVTWSSFTSRYNIDPETYDGYPGLKSYNAGISLTF